MEARYFGISWSRSTCYITARVRPTQAGLLSFNLRQQLLPEVEKVLLDTTTVEARMSFPEPFEKFAGRCFCPVANRCPRPFTMLSKRKADAPVAKVNQNVCNVLVNSPSNLLLRRFRVILSLLCLICCAAAIGLTNTTGSSQDIAKLCGEVFADLRNRVKSLEHGVSETGGAIIFEVNRPPATSSRLVLPIHSRFLSLLLAAINWLAND